MKEITKNLCTLDQEISSLETLEITLSEPTDLRLDKLLSDLFPTYSRSYFQYLIDLKLVLINGLPAKKHHKPSKGDALLIHLKQAPQLSVQAESIPLDILFEDEHLLIVNKAVGMVVHPAPGTYNGTFANALVHHCQTLDPEEFDYLRPGIVHRLDKDTSGILIGVKTSLAHQKLSEQFKQRSIEKYYLAICIGSPPEGLYSAPIKRHPLKRKEMTVDIEGREAVSDFHLLAKKENLSLVQVRLITGRTHQIRVHLKHVNCPILGDAIYGSSSANQKYQASRQLLHAYKIKFQHPFSEQMLELFAPIPEDMKNFIDLINSV